MSRSIYWKAGDAAGAADSRTGRLTLLVVWLLAAAGCGGFAVELGDANVLPTPLVETLPLRLGVVVTEEFAGYRSEQESVSGQKWSFDVGQVQSEYLDRVLRQRFSEVVMLEEGALEGSVPEGFDLFLVPSIDDYSFLTPAESGSSFFAVSMRHMFTFLNAKGEPLEAWEINSYGRSRDSLRTGMETVAREAALVAMRDMATTIAVELPNELDKRGIEFK